MTEPNREAQALSAAIEMFADLDSAVNLMTDYSARHRAFEARLNEMAESFAYNPSGERPHMTDCPWDEGLSCECYLSDVHSWIDYVRNAL